MLMFYIRIINQKKIKKSKKLLKKIFTLKKVDIWECRPIKNKRAIKKITLFISRFKRFYINFTIFQKFYLKML